MNAEVYEKVYFHENYASAFASLYSEYGERAQELLHQREVDHTPKSNIDSVVFLDGDDEGGYTVGGAENFIEYYERTFGQGKIARVRADLARAAKKAEAKPRAEKQPKQASARESVGIRFTKPRFTLLQGVFAMMLIFSLVLFGVSGALLKKSHEDMLLAETAITELEEVRADRKNALDEKNKTAEIDRLASEYGFVPREDLPVTYLDLGGEDTVEIINAKGEDSGYATLLDALAALFKS